MTAENLAKVIWESDDEWKRLDARQALDVSADWGEWIANSVLQAMAEELRAKLNPITFPGTNSITSSPGEWILLG